MAVRLPSAPVTPAAPASASNSPGRLLRRGRPHDDRRELLLVGQLGRPDPHRRGRDVVRAWCAAPRRARAGTSAPPASPRTACPRCRRSRAAGPPPCGRTARGCGRRRPSPRPRRRASARAGSGGVIAVKISESLRGVAWQKSTGPSPSTSIDDRARASRRRRRARRRQPPGHPGGPPVPHASRRPDRDPRRSNISRSVLPRTHATRSPSASEHAQRLRRHRPGQRVAADDHEIRRGDVRLGQDGLERGQVAVDVVQRRDRASAARYRHRRARPAVLTARAGAGDDPQPDRVDVAPDDARARPPAHRRPDRLPPRPGPPAAPA